MKRHRLLFIVILALILAVVIALWPARIDPNSAATGRDATRTEAPDTSDGGGASTRSTPAAAAASDDVATLRQQIDDLALALAAAGRERELAEAELEKSEQAVAELERFVEEIEARGEDPVDYADEGLKQFVPAFDQYQRAADRLEIAEAMELSARDALAKARRELEQRQGERDSP